VQFELLNLLRELIQSASQFRNSRSLRLQSLDVGMKT
jgi:hypothetical protein